jgi:hypothetical protein
VLGECSHRENLAVTREKFLGGWRALEVGNRVFRVFVTVKNKYCVFSTFADDGKSTNPQVRRF